MRRLRRAAAGHAQIPGFSHNCQPVSGTCHDRRVGLHCPEQDKCHLSTGGRDGFLCAQHTVHLEVFRSFGCQVHGADGEKCSHRRGREAGIDRGWFCFGVPVWRDDEAGTCFCRVCDGAFGEPGSDSQGSYQATINLMVGLKVIAELKTELRVVRADG